MAGQYPAWQIDFAPGIASTAVPSGGDWVDITNRVLSIEVRAGRQDDATDFGAGSATLELDNAGGRFDPDAAFDASLRPYAGDLLPLTWFRIRGGTTSANTGVFYGQVSIDGWRLAASQHPASVVTVDLVDLFEQLKNTLLPASVWDLFVAGMGPLSWWKLGETSGTTMVDSSGNGHHGTYLSGDTFNSRPGLVDSSSDTAIEWVDGLGAEVLLVDHPTAAITSYPFSLAFWVESEPTDAGPPYVSGKDLFWQETSTGGGYVIVELVGSSGSGGIGILDDAITINFYSDSGRRGWVSSSVIADGEPHLVTITVVDADNVTGSLDGESMSFTIYSTSGSAPTMSGGERQVLGRGFSNPSAVHDEMLVFDSVIDTTEAANLYAAGAAPWEGDLTGTRIDRLLDAIGLSASLRTTADGKSTMPAAELGGDVLSALIDAVKAENGELDIDHQDSGKVAFRDRHARWTEARSLTSQATFGDSGAEITYSAIDLQDDRIINSATVQRTGGATVTVEDAASITQYQLRSHAETGLLLEDDTDVVARANMIVAEKKDRHRRVRSITLEPASSTHPAWAQVFARRIGDRITTKWRPSYGGTYSWDSWIIGISHSWRFGDDKPLRTQFFLEPVPYDATAEPYFIVGTSTVSGPARIGY